MKFDYCIGNPPYQEKRENTSDKPVYNDFMDAVYTISDKVELITPARFLFNAGKTPKEWNEQMLQDEHLKVLSYEPDSKQVFPSIKGITGGVVITYHNNRDNYGAIGSFVLNDNLRNILSKIKEDIKINGSIKDIMILQNRFDLGVLFEDYPKYKTYVNTKGEICERTERRLVSSSFTTFEIFKDTVLNEDCYDILGIINSSTRIHKYVKPKYILDNGNLFKYKVVVPKASGTGLLEHDIAPICGKPDLLAPKQGYTQSFIGISGFESKEEALASFKYIKSKFARVCLGILKVTQDNPPEKWAYVPLQNFTSNSDIDWNKSISDIDKQLYQKYGLSDDEINFIETHVKEMN